MAEVLKILSERGFIYQQTHEEELSRSLEKPSVFYVGFDPTAESLHVGSLVPIMGMRWMQQFGHIPIAIVGGGTARVGDPSGKTEMRQMLSTEQLDRNEEGLKRQLSHFLDLDGVKGKMINNKDWLLNLGYIDFLREVGRHFSVNRMLTAESVKQRLEKGLSFIEFNYMILQAYDFYVLARDHKCSLQMGGQDQWGNIVAGTDLCRRMGIEHDTFGLTFPLLTNSSGKKFGKSEDGNVWLDRERTPVIDYYQFWRNTEDADLEKCMKLFTQLPVNEIDSLLQSNINRAKEILAFEATALNHGFDEASRAFATAVSKFGSADPDRVVPTSSRILEVDLAASVDMPSVSIGRDEAAEMTWASLIVRAEFAKSKGEARRLIKGRGVKQDDLVIEDADALIPAASFVLRVGKKRFKQILVD